MKRLTLISTILAIIMFSIGQGVSGINRNEAIGLLGTSVSAFIITDFIAEQKKHERVRTAYRAKGQLVAAKLKENNIQPEELNTLIIVYKEEQRLELYAKRESDIAFKKISTYDICAISGQPGPKRMQGDKQVPEGFYFIDEFNPVSSFYLSLGINYPNASDKKKSNEQNPGGDIFIHGSCVTIGCIPVTDDKIKEIYLYAIQARQNGQLKIPVYIFPFIMTSQNMKDYKATYIRNEGLLRFWDNLKAGHDKFEVEKRELNITVDDYGNYSFPSAN